MKEAQRGLLRMVIGEEGLKRIKSREHGRRTFILEQKGVLTENRAWDRIIERSSSHGLSVDDAIIGYYEGAVLHRAEVRRLTPASSKW